MSKRVVQGTAFMLACLASSVSIAEAQQIEHSPLTLVQATPQRLTGAAAIAAIAGNTLTGKIDGADNVIFFANDGRMTMVIDAEQTQGKWELRGMELCFIVEDEDDECYGFEVNGDEAVLREDATTSYRMAIAKGNVKNLPLGKR